MAADSWLGHHAEQPTLRLYGWSATTLSLGRNQKADWLDRVWLDSQGIPVVRRPSGGRALLHQDELTYAVILPAATTSGSLGQQFCLITGWLGAALRSLGVPVEPEREKRPTVLPGKQFPGCMEVVGRGELLLEGCKLVGSAQLRTRNGLLQHGVLPLRVDAELLKRCIPGSLPQPGLVELGYPAPSAGQLAHAFLKANGFDGQACPWSSAELAAIERWRAAEAVR